jgi:hypothetical protein
MIGIKDRSIAFAFDMRCGELLLEFENERDRARLEAVSMGALSQSLLAAAVGSQSRATFDRSNAVTW